MKRPLALLGVGFVALAVQGGVASFLPHAWCPDLGFLIVLALGLHWRGIVGGLLVVTLLGYTIDLLSGSLFGLHALLAILLFCTSALARRQLNLRGTRPLMVFAGVMTAVYAFGFHLLSNFFGSPTPYRWELFALLVPHVFVNAITAPMAAALIERIWERLGESETMRGGLELDARGPLS